jgi:ubiquinol-cytochrome c reductase cytochrome b subunit
MSMIEKAGGATATFVDERIGANKWLKKNLNKVFPGHWSFLLGEIALYSFIVILLSGVFLTFWFRPSMVEVIYNGSYEPLNGIKMSEAYASTINISFDVRGGLLMRQVHHWAALIFVSAIMVHLFRVFFTGAFRKPRELNWIIGSILLILAIVEGFIGYSLPDDLLSGTGLRITQGITQAVPVVGTYLAFFLFGGEFPGQDIIPRFYTIHVLLIPGIILALITFHMLLIWYQKHTQYPGPGRTNNNVLGAPFLPVFMTKAGGFFFIVFGVSVVLSAIATINPVWMFGPYNPSQITAGSQPDWYMGFLDGAVRLMPNWEFVIPGGYTVSMNIIIPAMVLPGLLFTPLILYPFIERWITGDGREHNLLDRPRNVPVRTALGVTAIVFWFLLLLGAGNDIIATQFDLSINTITWTLRAAIFIVPPIVYVVTKRICISLQRRDRDKLLHGRETGRIVQLPGGEFIEVHEPVGDEDRAVLLANPQYPVYQIPPATDENGVPSKGGGPLGLGRLRARLSRAYYGDVIHPPTQAELDAAAHHHAEVAAAEQAQDAERPELESTTD